MPDEAWIRRSMSDLRPVWLTREQRDHLNPREVLAAWDAAPADATETVIAWFDAQFDLDDEAEDLAASVKSLLRALGMPDA